MTIHLGSEIGIKPKLITATHGHFDHILAATELRLAFNIPFLIHQADLPILKRTPKTAKYFTGIVLDPPPKVDQFIKENDLIKFGKEKLKILETPGHSPGGVAFFAIHPRGGVAPAAHLGGEGKQLLVKKREPVLTAVYDRMNIDYL